MPAIAMTAQIYMQLGIPFNAPRAIMQAAEELGIESLVMEAFEDPTFMQRMQLFQQNGPQESGKGMSSAGVMQNGGYPMAQPVMSPGQEFNQQAQQTAAVGQSAFGVGGGL